MKTKNSTKRRRTAPFGWVFGFQLDLLENYLIQCFFLRLDYWFWYTKTGHFGTPPNLDYFWNLEHRNKPPKKFAYKNRVEKILPKNILYRYKKRFFETWLFGVQHFWILVQHFGTNCLLHMIFFGTPAHPTNLWFF